MLAEACRRANAGEAFEQSFSSAIGEFLQSYYLASSIDARVPMLADEPERFDDQRYEALVGGIAEYLSSAGRRSGRRPVSRADTATSTGADGRSAREMRA